MAKIVFRRSLLLGLAVAGHRVQFKEVVSDVVPPYATSSNFAYFCIYIYIIIFSIIFIIFFLFFFWFVCCCVLLLLLICFAVV